MPTPDHETASAYWLALTGKPMPARYTPDFIAKSMAEARAIGLTVGPEDFVEMASQAEADADV